jgi:hypothetical protein
MKTIIATTFALAIATSASAFSDTETVTWGGKSNDIHANQCAFYDANAGVMTYDTNAKRWSTGANPATVKVRHKGANNMNVATDGKLYKKGTNTSVLTTTVNYASGTSASFTNNNQNVAGSGAHWQVPNANTYRNASVITVGGTAQVDTADVNKMVEGQDYVIKHTVTCTQ